MSWLHLVCPYVNSNIYTFEQRETTACGGLLSPFYKILQDFISLVEPSESDASQTIVHQAPILSRVEIGILGAGFD